MTRPSPTVNGALPVHLGQRQKQPHVRQGAAEHICKSTSICAHEQRCHRALKFATSIQGTALAEEGDAWEPFASSILRSLKHKGSCRANAPLSGWRIAFKLDPLSSHMP